MFIYVRRTVKIFQDNHNIAQRSVNWSPRQNQGANRPPATSYNEFYQGYDTDKDEDDDYEGISAESTVIIARIIVLKIPSHAQILNNVLIF